MMMVPAFMDPGLWGRFYSALKSWEGTPYRHLQYTKGRGADCALFIGAALHEAGIMREMHPPKYYPKDWYRVGREDLIRVTLLQHFRDYTPKPYCWVELHNPGVIERGDVLMFDMLRNGITNHVAVYCGDDTLCHSVVRKHVLFSTYVSFWERHIAGVFRLCEER